jgi:hypothetical protein
MSAWGQTRTYLPLGVTSALPPKADSSRTSGHVRFVQPAQPVDATLYLRGKMECSDGSGISSETVIEPLRAVYGRPAAP